MSFWNNSIIQQTEFSQQTGTTSRRDKIEVTLIVLGIAALIVAVNGISYGVVANHVTAKNNLTKVVEGTSDQVSLAIKDMQRYLSSLACMVMDHRLVPDFLLTKQGGGGVPSPILPIAHI
jgi:hypothetical protein